ncbi:MAG: hypothetical protein A2660_03275 [Candidatus Doudnabacteria bacterium RIFCSPHIGHO2_01_FULL_45_18]|uniref:Peptidase S8/S53 domain-containing protein n=1 Tax=Candidatus Doudnabacteria bacterium RIFCSPHIGHO2_01_FULL_45_18 TaxID=1817823 RepID=A0A1F5NQC2_9BACT|nr:MAG: hypothetical protein A2660_03275 [Candidatus Doudnabacteria bacterium RIFCSPHIGHO2_01_FULL_45_18]
MRFRFPIKYRKILGSLLLPVFLLAPLLPNKMMQNEPNIPITFQIKNFTDNQKIFDRYGLETQALFQNIFKARVSDSVFKSMQRDPKIAYAEEDQRVHASVIVTSDPFFTTDAIVEDKQWYLAKTQVPLAWDYTQGTNNVTVAIIDTGIHRSHVELNDGRIIDGFDVMINRPIPLNFDSDDNGHGTAVAGVIGAIPNNNRGIAGINWQVKLMPVKALGADGTGDTSNVAAAIVWATDHQANIINLSLGGPGFGGNMTLSNAITYAYDRGVLIVAAAGNDQADKGQNLDATPTYPVCGDNGKNMVLGVAATDINDQKTSFSNFGSLCIDISAPGKRILSTAFLPSSPSNNLLIYGSGTSLATPIVSGVAALIKSTNPNLSNVEIREKLIRTTDSIDWLNQTSCLGGSCNGFLGSGRINALSTIAPPPLADGSLIRSPYTGEIYLISNNAKRPISNFVFAQRGFRQENIITAANNQLVSYPTATPLPPLDTTLIKSENYDEVFVVVSGMKRPLTYLVFISRGYNFANIKILPQSEIDNLPTGEWYEPPDQTMVLVLGDPTVYVIDKGTRRAVTFFVFQQRNLSFSKVINVTPDEFSHIPQSHDSYWLSPLDQTLVKLVDEPSVYVIENGTKRLLSLNVFVSRGYDFRNVVTLPKVEMDVIAAGMPIES